MMKYMGSLMILEFYFSCGMGGARIAEGVGDEVAGGSGGGERHDGAPLTAEPASDHVPGRARGSHLERVVQPLSGLPEARVDQ